MRSEEEAQIEVLVSNLFGAIRENNAKDFITHLKKYKDEISQTDYDQLRLLEAILQHKATKILPLLLKKGNFTKIISAYAAPALYLVVCRYAAVFNVSDKMKALRIKFINQKIRKSKLKTDCLNILNAGESTPIEEFNNHNIFPSFATICAANNRADLFKFIHIHDNAKTSLQDSPMVAAVLNNSQVALNFMVNKGIKLDNIYHQEIKYSDLSGASSWVKLESKLLLSIAAEINNPDMFKLLCSKGATISKEVMEIIVRLKNENILDLCIAQSADLYQKILEHASAGGDCNFLNLSLEKILKINPDYELPGSVLESALLNGHLDVVKFLHETKKLPLPSFFDKNILKYFYQAQGCPPSILEHEQNVLKYLLLKDYNPLVNYLMGLGINHQSYTPEEWEKVLIMMVQKNYLGGIVDDFKTHPVAEHSALWGKILSEAINFENLRIIEALFNRGLALNQFDEHGLSPLFWAICQQKINAAKKLIELDPAVLQARNSFGETAVMIATQCKDEGNLLSLILESLKSQLKKEEIANFVNLKSTQQLSALNSPFDSRLDPFLNAKENLRQSKLNLIKLLRNAGAKFFEEKDNEGKVEIVPCYLALVKGSSKVSATEWVICLRIYVAAEICTELDQFPLSYFPVLSDLSKEQHLNIKNVLISKTEHMKHWISIQGGLEKPASVETEQSLIQSLNMAFGISPKWTQFMLLTLFDEISDKKEKLENLCKAILALPFVTEAALIHLEIFEKCKSKACSLLASEQEKKKCDFLMLAIIFAHSIPEESKKGEEIALLYQLLIGEKVSDFKSYDELETSLQKQGEDQILTSWKIKIDALRNRLFISEELKIQNNQTSFIEAARKNNRELMENLIKMDPDLPIRLLVPSTPNAEITDPFSLCTGEIRKWLLKITANIILSRQNIYHGIDLCCTLKIVRKYSNEIAKETLNQIAERTKVLQAWGSLRKLRKSTPRSQEFFDFFAKACQNSLTTVKSEFEKALTKYKNLVLTCLILAPHRETSLCEMALTTFAPGEKEKIESAYHCLLALRLFDPKEAFPALTVFSDNLFKHIGRITNELIPPNMSLDKACDTYPKEIYYGLILIQIGFCYLLDRNIDFQPLVQAFDSNSKTFTEVAHRLQKDIGYQLQAANLDLPGSNILLRLQNRCLWALEEQASKKLVVLEARMAAFKHENLYPAKLQVDDDKDRKNENDKHERPKSSEISFFNSKRIKQGTLLNSEQNLSGVQGNKEQEVEENQIIENDNPERPRSPEISIFNSKRFKPDTTLNSDQKLSGVQESKAQEDEEDPRNNNKREKSSSSSRSLN